MVPSLTQELAGGTASSSGNLENPQTYLVDHGLLKAAPKEW